MSDEILPGEQFIEDMWKAQGGCDPVTGKGWLTPRMERNVAFYQIRELELWIKHLKDSLQEIHLTAHCIAKAGPLTTPTLQDAWGKFMKLSVMATAALTNSRSTMNEPRLTDKEIDTQRIAGDIIIVLQTGSPEERASLLRVIASLQGQQYADELSKEYPSQY